MQATSIRACTIVVLAIALVGASAPSVLAQPTTPAAPTAAPAPDAAPTAEADPSTLPTAIRLRRLEQRVQALKERAWRSKARVGMLQESVLGGGVGAQAVLTHANKMGSSFRLIKLVYSMDGSQIFARTDDAAESLYKTSKFEIFAGPISPGSHNISVVAVYRGHGYGVFQYLTKYTFQVRSSHTFTATEGRITKVEASGYEKGGATTPLEKRPAIDFKVSVPTEKTPDTAAGTTAAPEAAPATAPATTPAAPTTDAPATDNTPK